jgi:hypothetical protein
MLTFASAKTTTVNVHILSSSDDPWEDDSKINNDYFII